MKKISDALVFNSLLLILAINGFCQNSQPDSLIKKGHIELQFVGGSLILHHQELKILQEGYISAIEIAVGINSTGTKSWQSAYNYPRYGVAYHFMNLGSNLYLGYSHAIMPYITFSLLPKDRKIYLDIKTAAGLSYITKKYDEVINPQNLSISTNINSYIKITTETGYSLSKNLSVVFGAGLNHISNGNFKKPNYGLNFITLSGGLVQKIGKTSSLAATYKTSYLKKNRLNLIGTFSAKEEKDPGGPKFFVLTGSLEFCKEFSEFIRFCALVDVIHDKSTTYVLDYENIVRTKKPEFIKAGVSIQPEFVFDRLSFIFGLGIYAYNKNPNNGLFYQRLGFRYRISPKLWTHLALKTHWNIADYVEIGLVTNIWKWD